jgi:hypothetical protein
VKHTPFSPDLGASGVFFVEELSRNNHTVCHSEGGKDMFENEWRKFLEDQRSKAMGTRLERLKKDLTGEKKMLEAAIWPVLKSFDDLILEYEISSLSGVRMYVDVFYVPIGIAFESEGFVVHAENITRERFDFERIRVRTMMMNNYKYIPFSWDELDKKPDVCRRTVYELLGRYSATKGNAYDELTVYEREVLRYASRLNRTFRSSDISYCLQVKEDTCRKVLRILMQKKLIKSIGTGKHRFHEYTLDAKASDYLL